jgi:hypothetical protein
MFILSTPPTESFETISRNLNSYPASLTYNSQSQLVSIVYTISVDNIVTKLFTYENDLLTSISLLKNNIPYRTKIFNYVNNQLIGFTYTN